MNLREALVKAVAYSSDDVGYCFIQAWDPESSTLYMDDEDGQEYAITYEELVLDIGPGNFTLYESVPIYYDLSDV